MGLNKLYVNNASPNFDRIQIVLHATYPCTIHVRMVLSNNIGEFSRLRYRVDKEMGDKYEDEIQISGSDGGMSNTVQMLNQMYSLHCKTLSCDWELIRWRKLGKCDQCSWRLTGIAASNFDSDADVLPNDTNVSFKYYHSLNDRTTVSEMTFFISQQSQSGTYACASIQASK